MVLATLITSDGSEIDSLAWLTALPFLILGLACQVSVQQRTQSAWAEQQAIWKATFRAAPSFENGTMVLFVLPGYSEETSYQTWGRTPLDADWDTSAALRLLYGNPTLRADVLFPDVTRTTEPILTLSGVQNWQTRLITPYSSVIAFQFDRDQRNLRQLTRLPGSYIQGGSGSGSVDLCSSCITAEVPGEISLRRLVDASRR
jgi:hypothetical protein